MHSVKMSLLVVVKGLKRPRVKVKLVPEVVFIVCTAINTMIIIHVARHAVSEVLMCVVGEVLGHWTSGPYWMLFWGVVKLHHDVGVFVAI